MANSRNKLRLLFLATLVSLLSAVADGNTIGLNWGRMSYLRLPPKLTVSMLQKNNVQRLKLFSAEPEVMLELLNKGFEVMVAATNGELATLASSAFAENWVDFNIKRYAIDSGVNIKYIAVGNEAFLTSYGLKYVNLLYPAMYNIYQAVVKAGLQDKVKVVTPLNLDVLTACTASACFPSGSSFRPDIVNEMQKILQLLADQKAFFLINIYPYLTYVTQPNIPLDFIFPGRGGGVAAFTDPGNSKNYTSLFDASFDSVVAAMAALGFPNLELQIGEIGWPSQGGFMATPDNAREFNQRTTKHFLSGEGTPLRPGVINGYLFAVFDEDKKDIAPGTFERHWGIWSYNGIPKYNLDLQGTGDSNQILQAASGVRYMPSRWCVANQTTSPFALKSAMIYACNQGGADCTAQVNGSGCEFPNDPVKAASYAFNQYYQIQNQSAASCFFGGAGYVTTSDPSTSTCAFTLAIDMTTGGASKVQASFLWLMLMLCAWLLL